jgi:hypothetical protein
LDAPLVNKQNVVGEYFSPFFPHPSFLPFKKVERKRAKKYGDELDSLN